MTLEVGENFTDRSECHGCVDGNRNVSISGTVDTSKLGIYTLTYTATDLSGNSVKATRTVRVVGASVLRHQPYRGSRNHSSSG